MIGFGLPWREQRTGGGGDDGEEENLNKRLKDKFFCLGENHTPEAFQPSLVW